MTTLNTAFEQQLALEDEGYESSLENFNIPTPLRKMPKIHHVSSIKNASFDPNLVMPCSTVQSHLRPVCQQLPYSSSDNSDTSGDSTSSKNNSNRCPGIPRRRWRLSDGTFGWQTLGYQGSAWQNIMHTQTCLTAWTMPLSVPLFKLFTSFLCQLHRFKWQILKTSW